MKMSLWKVKSSWMVVILLAVSQQTRAQDPISGIIAQGITRVIRAFDLEVQRLQTATIWLQDAQKVAENAMQELRLDEIRDWVAELKDLYGSYFDELWRVKQVITDYHRVKTILNREAQLVDAYRRCWTLLQQDSHFTTAELQHMQAVYAGILDESLKNLNLLSTVLKDFLMQITDADRLAIINRVEDGMDKNYNDLLRFNNENALLSLQRARDQGDVEMVKKMYGL
jgi:hypothetical protein